MVKTFEPFDIEKCKSLKNDYYIIIGKYFFAIVVFLCIIGCGISEEMEISRMLYWCGFAVGIISYIHWCVKVFGGIKTGFVCGGVLALVFLIVDEYMIWILFIICFIVDIVKSAQYSEMYKECKEIVEGRFEILQREYEEVKDEYEQVCKMITDEYGYRISKLAFEEKREKFYNERKVMMGCVKVAMQRVTYFEKYDILDAGFVHYVEMLNLLKQMKQSWAQLNDEPLRKKTEKDDNKQKENPVNETQQKDDKLEKLFDGCDTHAKLDKRWKQLLKIYHPDNNGSTEMTQEINDVYNKLKNKLN